MTINLWEVGGRPTSYNPLPTGWTEFITIDVRSYEVSFQAKSALGVKLGVKQDTQNVYLFNQNLTTEFKEYRFSFTNSMKQPLYIRPSDGALDIVIKDIMVTEKSMGKATINGVDGFGNIKEGFTGKMSAIADFTGKISGSLAEVSHRASHSTVETTVKPPSFFTFEAPQSNYDSAMFLDGNRYTASRVQTNAIAQQLFSFNVIAEIEKQIGKIPASTIDGKVTWIKDNINQLVCNWLGFGTSGSGNKATLKVWSAGAWTGGATHSQGTVTKASQAVMTFLNTAIQNDGYVHFIAYAEPSDGVTASSITTDYVSLDIQMKQETVIDSKWTFNPNVTLINDETIEINTTAPWQESSIIVPCLPSTTYIFKLETSSGAGAIITPLKVDGSAVGANIQNGAFVSTPFTTPVNAFFLKIRPMSNGIGKYTLSRPMLNMGNTPIPYSKKTGERMVMPAIVKNLVQESNITLVAPTTTNVIHDERIYTKLGATYTISGIIPTGVIAQPRIGSTSNIYNGMNLYGNGTRQSMTFVAIDEVLVFRKYTNGVAGTFEIKELQIEEYPIATSYEPFKVKINSKANKTYMGINLLPPAWSKDWWEVGSAKYVAIEDYKLRLTATLDHQYRRINIKVKANTNYIFSGNHNGKVGVYDTNGSTSIQMYTTAQSFTFNSGERTELRLYLTNMGMGIGQFYFDDLQIVEGSSLTAFKPQTLMNKPSAKNTKNLVTGEKEQNNDLFNSGTGSGSLNVWENGRLKVTAGSSNNHGKGLAISVEIGKKYTFSCRASGESVNTGTPRIIIGATDKGAEYTSSFYPLSNPEGFTFTATSSMVWVRFLINGATTLPPVYFWNIQLEEGSWATKYKPFKVENKSSLKGLKFEGNSYITLPSMTMDTIEVDCIIDSAQPTNYSFIFDARNDAQVWTSNASPNISNNATIQIDGEPVSKTWTSIPKDKRIKVTTINSSAFTSSVLYFARVDKIGKTSGTIFSIKCYLNGEVVAEYDLTNLDAIQGTTIKAVKGLDGVITGSPIPLLKRAKR